MIGTLLGHSSPTQRLFVVLSSGAQTCVKTRTAHTTQTRATHVGDARRFILASDGLWETLNLKVIAKLAFMHGHDPKKCASTLLKCVRLECAKLNGVREHPFKDDTTIAVVDIIPEPSPPAPFASVAHRRLLWFCWPPQRGTPGECHKRS